DNYRSCPNIVEFTNRFAAQLFENDLPKPSNAKSLNLCEGKPVQDCIRLVEIESDQYDAVHLRVLSEANWLADTIAQLGSYKDIAILLRKLTNAHLYIDALTTRGVPVVVEGEKFFYRSQEVIDFLNLLKYIVDPMDSIALAGMLRSPLFGL